MSTATLDLTGLDRLQARFKRIANPDATPLMVSWMSIIDSDNRRGVLAGTDKDGQPMAPVTYRPKKLGEASVPLTLEQRLGQRPNIKRGKYSRIGSGAARVNNNLTSAEYRLLDGPALAPRRQFSRVITNLLTDYSDGRQSSGQWEAWGYWDEVLSVKGVPFLIYHFDGEGNNPQRDLRGVRPDGKERAKAALRAWAIDMVRTSGDAGAHTPASHPKVAV
jgi:hypothetical protein